MVPQPENVQGRQMTGILQLLLISFNTLQENNII
jgi:hypothetical protein